MRRHLVFIASLSFASAALAAPPPPQGMPPRPGEAAPPPMPHFTLKPVVKGTGPANTYSKEQISRGEYLVRFGGCDDCHTAKVFDAKANMPVPDLARRLAGHPEGAPDPYSALAPGDTGVIGPTFTSFRTGFGVVYTANLTPDLETGTGAWTEENFMATMRTGKHFGNGRPILPPMPWFAMAKLTDEDLRSLFAFMRSLPPVKNKVPAVTLPEPAMKALLKANSTMMAP